MSGGKGSRQKLTSALVLRFSPHALAMMAERGIAPDWVERTMSDPDDVEPDPAHSERRRAFRSIAERDGRVLRVVYIEDEDAARIITVFLDRGRRRNP